MLCYSHLLSSPFHFCLYNSFADLKAKELGKQICIQYDLCRIKVLNTWRCINWVSIYDIGLYYCYFRKYKRILFHLNKLHFNNNFLFCSLKLLYSIHVCFGVFFIVFTLIRDKIVLFTQRSILHIFEMLTKMLSGWKILMLSLILLI